MDTNTGKIYTAKELAREMELAKALTEPVAKEAPQEMSIDEMMAKFMPDYVPLKSLPDKNCKKCYGQGHTGRNVVTGKFIPCSCTK